MSDFIDTKGIGTNWPPASTAGGVLGAGARPNATRVEWGIKHYSRDTIVLSYDNEGAALRALTHQCKELDRMGIPKEYWPVLVRRPVETVVGEWRPVRE